MLRFDSHNLRQFSLGSLGLLSLSALYPAALLAEQQDSQSITTSSGAGTTLLSPVTIEAGAEGGASSISSELLQRRQASHSGEIFRGEAAANVGGGSRNAQRLYLRGIEANNLNVTIDGAREGRDLHQHRGGLSGIDPDLLKAVDIDPSPAADQGAGALGGSIRFTTKDAQDLLLPDKDRGARAKTGYASADKSYRGSTTAYAMLGQNTGILSHISAVNRDDYRIGEGGTMPGSGGRDRDYMLKLSRIPETNGDESRFNDHELRFSAQRNTFVGDHAYGSIGSDFGDPKLETRQDEVRQERERDTYNFAHHYDPDANHIDWRLNIYRNDNRLKRLDDDSETRALEHGADLRNTFTFHIGDSEHRLTAGADYYLEDGQNNRPDEPDLSHESRNLGLFLQNRMRYGRLGVSLGARFDDYSTEFFDRKLEGDALSPNISTDFEMTEGWTAFAGYGEAVSGSGLIPVGWMQFIDERTNLNNDEPFKAEESSRWEAGLDYESRGLFKERDSFKLNATYFETKIDNSIERDDNWGSPYTVTWDDDRRPPSVQKEDDPLVGNVINRDDTLITRGFEIRAAWGYATYDTQLSFMSAETVNEDGDPQGVSRRRGGIGGDRLVWDNRWAATEQITLGYTLTWVGDHTDVPDDEPERDGYDLHDIQVEWLPCGPSGLPGGGEELKLALAINNLFDTRYAEHTSLAWEDNGDYHIRSEPGRDVRITAELRF
ncbi:putative IRON-REGULATED OUTER MEMBRANE PROTEIN [Halorhodospira halochloris]|uniref:IRON-REGULATED OUTER MEMBRANE PROTEIN n=1 Tax=Halorhodospira halochloris TaxID=1052 RepID=A0A0X8X8Q2_HALHR|nr:TonB-dependent receptor [Halorhodospira halochloris]MBK1651336.1 ligand-gated channel protein [Halorhodospira halochloris]BAU57622.1 putative IRON-REGULATED OUTER MEMBRANE PROTEIN [Halorhodospira halochloris]